MTNEKQVGIYVKTLKNRLSNSDKRNKQLLTALRSAKKLIRFWYIISEYRLTSWKGYQNDPKMQRINKAIKDGKL